MVDTTANFALRVPQSTDHVRLWEHIGNLGDDVDSALNTVDIKGVVARARRSTPTGNITTTETGVLRLDGISVRQGRFYQICTSNLNMDTSVANDIGICVIRVSTSGAATTSSTQIAYVRQFIDDASRSNVAPENCFYVPSADATLSVLLSAQRVAGTGNLVVFASSVEMLDLTVIDLGPDPGDTGVVI